ncbi:hypothetical protein LTR53_001497 [Teratosphaeriaceae sp. CCFEE 6253]|nr:hypothetical protein LTR53_001497 [Teratosphaeriaceae sp. CCFEE 6253]
MATIKYRNLGSEQYPISQPQIERNRYGFGAALKFQIPHPDDLIFSATTLVLENYNKQDLRHVADPLLLEALSAAPTRYYSHGTAPAVHVFARAQTFIKAQLRLDFHLMETESSRVDGRCIVLTATSVAKAVVVRNGDCWVPLEDWLLTIPAQRMRNLHEASLELLRRQWTKTQKPFRFLHLPIELQRRILLLAIGEYIEPSHTVEYPDPANPLAGRNITNLTANGLEKIQDHGYRVNPLHEPLRPVNVALLCLSKLLRTIALDLLWDETIKRYQSISTFQSIPTHIPAQRFNCIRRLELALTHIRYFEVFRCPIKPFHDHVWASATAPARVLGQLPSLKHLEFFFMSTVQADYNPWPEYHRLWNGTLDETHFDLDFYRLPCQKTLVDWILVFAAEYIMDTQINTVKLSGFIKTETRKKWEAIMNTKRLEDVRDYLESEKLAILKLPNVEVPPRCYCPNPCGGVAVELDALRDGFDPRCTHGPGERCRCAFSATKPHEYKKAARAYDFDFDDSFEVVADDYRGNRDEWMRVPPPRD